ARNGWESTTDKLKHLARTEHLTLRQLALRTTTPKSMFTGTPTQVADTMQAWLEAGAADGFMISGAVLPDGLVDFIDHVLPILQERGLLRPEYDADPLRGTRGLPKPKNRSAIKARQETSTPNGTVHS